MNHYQTQDDGSVFVCPGNRGWDTPIIIDADDLERVLTCRWIISSKGYPINSSSAGTLRLARFILSPKPHEVVDVRSSNRCDCRKSNLRIATCAQIIQARHQAQRNSAHGYLGLTWRKDRQCWQAKIRVDGITHHLGYFKKGEENKAIAARVVAEQQFFGEFAPQR